MGAQLRLLIVARSGDHRTPRSVISEVPYLSELPRFVEVLWHDNHNQESMASIGNRYLTGARDVFGMVHADTSFHPYALDSFWRAARVGWVAGMVGINSQKRYIWSKQIHGIEPVETLDCCSVFFRTDSGLRFDERTFDGFHCYVEDLCLQARSHGISVVVPPAEASHHEDSTTDPAWRADYFRYKDKLLVKWGRTILTP